MFITHTSDIVLSIGDWDNNGEKLLVLWYNECKSRATIHRKHGFYYRCLYHLIGTCTILFSGMVLLFATPVLVPDTFQNEIISIIVSFITFIFTNLSHFLEFGNIYRRHFEFEARYTRICVEIEEIKNTQSYKRYSKQSILIELREKMTNLILAAPEI